MALEITARGKVLTDEKGRYLLHIDNPDWWAGELARFGPDVSVVISVKKWYQKRSLDQNSAFHWYVGTLADYFGYSPDTMKLLIKMKFLKVPLYNHDGSEACDLTTGEIMFELRETKSLSTMEMADLMKNIRDWAKEGWGIDLPEPNKNYKFNFKK